MSESAFPWPWRGPENRRLSLLVLGWIAAVHLWALAVFGVAPIAREAQWSPDVVARAPLLARFDSGWYDTIARNGYPPPPPPGHEAPHAFFPLYPLTVRALHLATGIESFRLGLAVSWAALLLAIPLFAEEARERLGEGRGREALPYLLLYPVAFFFAAVYTESLFLLLALLAFRSVRRDGLGGAAVFAFLLGLTRAPAVAIGPALALTWLAGRKPTRGRVAGAALLALLPLAGVLSWVFGVGLWKGEPMLFFRVMEAWRPGVAEAAGGPAAFVAELVRDVRRGHFTAHPGAVAPYFHLLLFAVLGALQAARRRWADAAWTAGVLSLPILTGTAAGIPRYTLTIYPCFTLAGELGAERPWLGRVWLGASAALLLVRIAFFVNWRFVS